MNSDELERSIRLLEAHRQIEQKIYRMGYALEDGDFELVGELLRHSTLGADMIGRRVFTGADEIRGQYQRTNIVYPGKGRATREMYTNVVVDIDLDAGSARSTTMYTVAQQIPDSGEPFAMLVAHTIIARAERTARQSVLAVPAVMRSRSKPVRTAGGPIIIVQCESFFDARRLSPLIPRGLLAGYDACCASAALFGRLDVPAWGANTMRAEFAVLTGIPESELGYDRFNPYYALARVPLESQVWRLRRAGYRTICLHPFDRRFFRRDLAMPALGFEQFLGRETLGGAGKPPYCPDPELAGQILRILDESGPRIFIFAITMGNHGPWLAKGPPIDPAVAGIFAPAEVPDGAGLLRYLDGLRRSDEMLRVLMSGLDQRGSPAMLAFYGDHLPSLSNAFRHFGFAEPSVDYAIWPGAMWPGAAAPQRRDLRAHELGRLIVDAALGPASGLPAREADAAPALDRGTCLALR